MMKPVRVSNTRLLVIGNGRVVATPMNGGFFKTPRMPTATV